MTTGLLDPIILAFVFAPPGVGAALLVAWYWRRARHEPRGLDASTAFLASAVRTLPASRTEWGAAMLAELAAVPGAWARWRFALGCARTALFPPRSIARSSAERSPVLGLLAVALPLLALPFIYMAAALFEAIGSGSDESHALTPVVKMLIVLTAGCLVAGVPLGLAGRWRRERMPWLTAWGIVSTAGAVSYFLLGMRLLAGGE